LPSINIAQDNSINNESRSLLSKRKTVHPENEIQPNKENEIQPNKENEIQPNKENDKKRNQK
jgi:hypothetical protein